jgi:hypothetical protein
VNVKNKIPKTVKLKTYLLSLALVSVIFLSTIAYVFSVGGFAPPNIYLDDLPSTATYVVKTDGTYYWAVRYDGKIAFNGAVASIVIQNVFNQNPPSVFFKTGTYDLSGQTVTAASPIIIEGEGKCSSIQGGTLKIVQNSWWAYGASVSNIAFNSTGSIVPLWLVELNEGIIHHVSFWKTSFSSASPSLLLTNCSSIKIDSNWFDGYNMQMIRIEGNPTVLAGSGTFCRITNNDFGSVNAAFPSFTDPSDVAAIYCAGNLAGFNLIDNNIAFMNPKNIFFYADDLSSNQLISNNRISTGTEDWAINLHAGQNIVTGNKISAVATYGRGIQVRTGSLTQITNNEFFGMDIAINGSMTTSIIANNIFATYNESANPSVAINFVNCPYNNIIGNYFYDIGSNSTTYFKDDVLSKQNQFSQNYISNATIFIIDAQTSDVIRHNFCYITENSGTQTISGSTSVTFNHGLDGTPTHVYCGFQTAGYGSWIWSATPTQITIAVNNTGTYNFSWTADIYN